MRSVRRLILTGLLCAVPLAAQESAAAPTQVMIVGTYHFANPGLDVVQTEVADVLSDEKQEEIAAVVEALARFRPTKVALERRPEMVTRVDSQYAAYRDGRHELSRNETQQLGFRLAARFDHERVYSVDEAGEFPFEDLMAYAGENDPEFVAWVGEQIELITNESNRRQRENTVGEILRMSNEPEELALGHGFYLQIARIGAGDGFVGAGLVADWYERNLKIFANLLALAEPGGRVLAIFGSGHAPILRELVDSHPDLELVDTLGYLP